MDKPGGISRRRFLRAAAGAAAGAALSGRALAQAFPPMNGYVPGHNPAFAQVTANLPQGFIHPTLASANNEPVGVRLVCLFDISGSIDQAEYDVQIEAMASAVASEDFRNAVMMPGGPKSLAICFADFGSTVAMRIPWLDLRAGDEDKFLRLANEIRTLKRREEGLTYQVRALEYSMTALEACPWTAKRNIVDMMTDGTDNETYGVDGERRLIIAREKLAKEYEATVNALVTIDPSSMNLERWAWEFLATPPKYSKANGTPVEPGFVKVVATEQSEQNQRGITAYYRAMELAFRRKLVLEVAGVELEELGKIMQAERERARKEKGLMPQIQEPKL